MHVAAIAQLNACEKYIFSVNLGMKFSAEPLGILLHRMKVSSLDPCKPHGGAMLETNGGVKFFMCTSSSS
jgi:hypothetical protein